ncbi:MAG: hypothetical protein JST86_07220 [Bacteroidetes bacterium]|nr:hypothetical protein [Bacteroidota bacterium]
MKYLLLVAFTAALFSCSNRNKTPDVSGIKIELTTQRFEKDFFKLDTTNNYSNQLNQLLDRYPSFGQNFIFRILGADPKWNNDSIASYTKLFSSLHRKVYDTSLMVFNNFSVYEAQVKKALQLVKYYFPNYKLPTKLITYIGPLDGFGDILADDAIIVGLQLHLGKNFSLYHVEEVQQTYPSYITNRFEPSYIAINCMKNIVSDLYPEKLEDKSLITQMVEKGKRLYLLSKLLPNEDEYKLIGYSKQQLKECYENEQTIWDMFIKNNLLQNTDENIVKNYIGESPKTQELGDASPGNIGAFSGWQIVKKYMDKNSGLTLQQLMAMDDDTLFQEAKYKP